MAKLIYTTTIPTGYAAEGNKIKVTPGICAGMTSAWCLRTGIGLRAEDTKLGFSESMILQFDYDAHGRNTRSLLLNYFPKLARYSTRMHGTKPVLQS